MCARSQGHVLYITDMLFLSAKSVSFFVHCFIVTKNAGFQLKALTVASRKIH